MAAPPPRPGAPRRALKLMRDEATVLAELKARQQLQGGTAVSILAVYVCEGAPSEFEQMYDGKVPIIRDAGLEGKLEAVVKARRASVGAVSGDCTGYKYLLVLRLAERSLSSVMQTNGIGGTGDFACVRKIVADVCKALIGLHRDKRIHGDLTPQHVVFSGGHWELLDLSLSCKIAKRYLEFKSPTPADCPPEMARVLVKAVDPATRAFRLADLKQYSKASVAYDLWGLGCILHELILGAPVWPAKLGGALTDAQLAQLAAWTPETLADILSAHMPKTTTQEQLAAVDLIRKLLEADEGARTGHFSGGGTSGDEIRAVLKHPFLTADAKEMAVAATAAATKATAEARAKAEAKKRAEEEEAAAKASLAAKEARLVQLDGEVAAMTSELQERARTITDLESRSASLATSLDLAKSQVAALEEREGALRAALEAIQGTPAGDGEANDDGVAPAAAPAVAPLEGEEAAAAAAAAALEAADKSAKESEAKLVAQMAATIEDEQRRASEALAREGRPRQRSGSWRSGCACSRCGMAAANLAWPWPVAARAAPARRWRLAFRVAPTSRQKKSPF